MSTIWYMKTLSFISGVVLSMAMVSPASAYIGVYQPRSTVHMTYTQGRGITKIVTSAPSTSVQKKAYQPKSTVPLTADWPEWIGVPSWIGGF